MGPHSWFLRPPARDGGGPRTSVTSLRTLLDTAGWTVMLRGQRHPGPTKPRWADADRGFVALQRAQTVAGMFSMAGASMPSTLWAWRRPRTPRVSMTAAPMKEAMAAHIAMVPRVAKA